MIGMVAGGGRDNAAQRCVSNHGRGQSATPHSQAATRTGLEPSGRVQLQSEGHAVISAMRGLGAVKPASQDRRMASGPFLNPHPHTRSSESTRTWWLDEVQY